MADKINYPESPQESPKRRVLFVITQSEFGGAQRFLHTLVTHLDKTKYDILVATGRSDLYPDSKIKQILAKENHNLINQLRLDGIKTTQLKHLQREIKPFSDIRALFELKKTIKKFNPDTLFLLSSKAGFIGSLAARNIKISKYRNIKIIYRIGGWSFNDPWPNWKK